MAKPVDLYLVRHGATYSNNKALVVGGGGSAPLSPIGRQQAKLVGLSLRDTEFEAVYASPLSRATETAELLIGNRQIPIITKEGLRDLFCGRLEGSSGKALREIHGSGASLFNVFGPLEDPDYISPYGAENIYHFVQRFTAELTDICKRHEGCRHPILIVCHSSVCYFLQQHMANAPANVANTSISHVRWADNRFTVVSAGDTGELERGADIAKKIKPLRLSLFGDVSTLFSEKGLLQGHSDSNFSIDGLEQAQHWAMQHSSPPFTAAYASPLNRALTLSDMLLPKGMQAEVLPALSEIFYGERECAPLHSLPPEEAAALLGHGPELLQYPAAEGGESAMHTALRLNDVLREIAEKHEFTEGHIAIFTHNVALHALTALHEGDLVINQAPIRITLLYQGGIFTRLILM